jgi:hypothetical protein
VMVTVVPMLAPIGLVLGIATVLCGTVARILQDMYPENVKRVLIIRSPYLFKTVWGLVKHFFDPKLGDLMVFGTSDINSQHVIEPNSVAGHRKPAFHKRIPPTRGSVGFYPIHTLADNRTGV